MSPMNRKLVRVVLVAIVIGVNPVHAQVEGVVTKPLLRTTVSGAPDKEAVILSGDFALGASTGWHSHPGDEYATVVEGTLELTVAGAEPRRIKAGESYHNAKDVVHQTRNVGEATAHIVSTFVIDKGKAIIEKQNGPSH